MTENTQEIVIPEGSRIVRIKDIEYVAKHVYFWNKEKKRGEQKRTYIGKIVDRQFVPNSAYAAEMKFENLKKRREQRRIGFDIDKSLGASALVQAAAEKSGIEEDLAEAYGPKAARMLVSLATYQIIKNTSALHRFAVFAQNHGMKKGLPEDVSSPRLSEFLKVTGADTSALNTLFRLRAKRLPEKEYLSFDSTRIPSQGRALTDVRKGVSKRGGYENQVGLAMLFGHNSGLPVMFRRFAGNVPDIITLHDLLCRWETLGEGKSVTAVFDRGYCSRENLMQLCQRNLSFVMAAKVDLGFVTDAIESNMAKFWDMKYSVSGHGATGLKHRIELKDSAGKPFSFWAYLYYSLEKNGSEQRAFLDTLDAFETDWSDGKADTQSSLLKYYSNADTAELGKKLTRDFDEINRKVRYMGFFAFLSSESMDPKDALEIYRSRDCIEKCFTAVKTDIGFTTTRGHSDIAVNARMLLAFVSATMVSWIVGRMAIPSKVARTKYPPLIDEYSLMEMLEELEQIRFYGTAGGKAWIGEVLHKHRQIFDRLGVADCLVDPATYN